METISYSQIHEIIKRLPTQKLQIAYKILTNLAKEEADVPSPQLNFMLLPLKERRQIMAQQAEKMTSHYHQKLTERLNWQGGDFIDEY